MLLGFSQGQWYLGTWAQEVERGCPCPMEHSGSRSAVSLDGDHHSPLVGECRMDLAWWGSLEAPVLQLAQKGAGCLPGALK